MNAARCHRFLRCLKSKLILRCLSFGILLFGPLIFCSFGKVAEAGVVIVSACLALAFSDIERFASLRGLGFEATLKEVQREVQGMKPRIDAATEAQTEPITEEEQIAAAPLAEPLSENFKAVLHALDHHTYTWRYLSGIRNDTKLPEAEIRNALDGLVQSGFARRSEGQRGPIWSITEEARGRRIHAEFEDVSNP